ncbi:hypothetical protein ADIS_1812 [Lunatimonas lonarensis]|uniref:Uncharacterized protein n=1 Tax=Lunatimonas lonarensis TaxID=1232681 RepID=R7ZU85_9BACT|nr:hypothetical protein ADIS_1812 [Lunatimonas lonarensis]
MAILFVFCQMIQKKASAEDRTTMISQVLPNKLETLVNDA